MKKLLSIIIVLIVLTSCNQNSLEDQYFEYCETDSISVGYQFTIQQNEDGSFQRINIFNPVYQSELIDIKGLVFATANTVPNPKGYWHFVKINSKGKDLPEEPLSFEILKTTRRPSFIGFHEWKGKNK